MSGVYLNYLIVFFLGATKFQVASVYGRTAGFSFSETFLLNATGGFCGVFFFMFLSTYLVNLFSMIGNRFVSKKKKTEQERRRKIFSPWRRILVRFMRKYGLAGIAFITPSVLSIPLGVFLAERLNSKFFHSRRMLAAYMTASVLFWALIFNALIHV